MRLPPVATDRPGSVVAALAGRALLIVLLGYLLALDVSAAQPLDLVPLRVTFNTVDEGDHFIYLSSEGEVWLRRESLRAFGYADEVPSETIEGDVYVPLHRLESELEFALDMRMLTLEITTEPEVLQPTVIDMKPPPPPELRTPDDRSAYLNYSADYTLGDEQEFRRLIVPYEIAMKLGPPLLYSSFLYERDRATEDSARLLTHLTWDFPSSLERFRAGDVVGRSGDLGSQVVVGGLALATSEELDPFRVRTPGIDVSGVATTPSDVKVQVNGLPVLETEVDPGAFEIRNLPYALGAGMTQIEITDAFGRTTTYEAPFYNSRSLLRQGLHEFGYYLGAVRETPGTEPDEYEELAFFGSHRYGFTDRFSASIEAEGTETRGHVGGSFTLLPWRIGEFSAAYAASRDGDTRGSAGLLAYEYAGRRISLNLFGQTATRDYATVVESALDDKIRQQWLAALGFRVGADGSLVLSKRHFEPYVEEGFYDVGATYTHKLGDQMVLLLRANERTTLPDSGEPEVTHVASATLLVLFGARATGTVGYDQEDERAVSRMRYQVSPPVGEGFGLRADVAHDSLQEADSGYNGSLLAQYHGRWAEYGIEQVRVVELNATTLHLAGSVAAIDGGVHLSRPIGDSFALVRTSGLEGVRVSSAHQEVGRTDDDGELLVPNLISYGDNAIEIEQRDIPFEYAVPTLDSHIAPQFRSGAVVDFRLVRTQAFIGVMRLEQDGARATADLATLEIQLPDGERQVVIGRGGEFYLENVPPGSYPVRVFRQDVECATEMEFPASEETFVDLGEITCRVD